MSSNPKYLDHELTCPNCGTIYLRIPHDVDSFTLIRCSRCDALLGTWSELVSSFDGQGGQNGVFEMSDGQIVRKD
ncbi:hypothetical protein HQ945_08915 [Phyllobacterium sp. BT25]|uniref:Uncharacterized protein n=1 Tax=Phyllobacterium pellucidum TaxID=2740464 RepID=A0A849VU48_9HYPH|nr:hypothetical protein [Phyllobacterium pellucidum]NTS31373.1 hypothetical protein [Phyllobacterium pellucidum]